MRQAGANSEQHDIKFPMDWTTFGGGLEAFTKKGVSLNVASFMGAATARIYVLGEGDVQPTAGRARR